MNKLFLGLSAMALSFTGAVQASNLERAYLSTLESQDDSRSFSLVMSESAEGLTEHEVNVKPFEAFVIIPGENFGRPDTDHCRVVLPRQAEQNGVDVDLLEGQIVKFNPAQLNKMKFERIINKTREENVYEATYSVGFDSGNEEISNSNINRFMCHITETKDVHTHFRMDELLEAFGWSLKDSRNIDLDKVEYAPIKDQPINVLNDSGSFDEPTMQSHGV